MKPDGDIILITGANGRIGTAVMRELRKTFSNVVGFDLQSPPDPPEGCTRIPVDITSDSSVTEGLRILRAHHGDRIASVIHLAAYYDFIGKPSPKYDEVTVNGTRRLLAGPTRRVRRAAVRLLLAPCWCTNPASRVYSSPKIGRSAPPGPTPN